MIDLHDTFENRDAAGEKVYADCMHPNTEGYRVVAKEAYNVITTTFNVGIIDGRRRLMTKPRQYIIIRLPFNMYWIKI